MSDLSFKACFAVGCDATIPRHMLMCRDHWFTVPMNAREDVSRTWAAWERGSGSIRAYVLATLRAQLAIAEKEEQHEAAKGIRNRIIAIQLKEAT